MKKPPLTPEKRKKQSAARPDRIQGARSGRRQHGPRSRRKAAAAKAAAPTNGAGASAAEAPEPRPTNPSPRREAAEGLPAHPRRGRVPRSAWGSTRGRHLGRFETHDRRGVRSARRNEDLGQGPWPSPRRVQSPYCRIPAHPPEGGGGHHTDVLVCSCGTRSPRLRAPRLRSGQGPLHVVEGPVKALALVARGIKVVALGGVETTLTKDNRGLNDSWAVLNIAGTDVVVLFDADRLLNPAVALAEARLVLALERREPSPFASPSCPSTRRGKDGGLTTSSSPAGSTPSKKSWGVLSRPTQQGGRKRPWRRSPSS